MTKQSYVLAALSALIFAWGSPVFAHDHDDDYDGHRHGHHQHEKPRNVYYSYTVVQPQVTRQRVVTTYGGPIVTGTTVISTTRPIASGGDDWLNYRISTREATVLQSYYQPYWSTQTVTTTLPPGLYRHKHLPYGWQKKLHRGYQMESEMYEYAQPVPVQVIQQLPPQPEGTVLVEIDGQIVRLAQATQTIIDILDL